MEFVRTSAAGYEKVLDIARLLHVNVVDHAMPMATFGNNLIRS